MKNLKTIDKLGTSTSTIKKDSAKYYKRFIVKTKYEADILEKGIHCINNKYSQSIEMPINIKFNESEDGRRSNIVNYEQNSLKPWIIPEWITGEQLYWVGQTILNQQLLLIENECCLVDARPDNYWLATNKGRLVDLGSIKPLTNQNLLSFEIDFKNHFIHPLILEKSLNIPVSLFFKGKLQSTNMNLWGLSRNFKSLENIKDLIKHSTINYISNKISSSSPDFIKFLNSEAQSSNKDLNIPKVRDSIRKKIIQINEIKPCNPSQSNWQNYKDFHDKSYNEKKISAIKDFVEMNKLHTKIVDLGANLTTKDINEIHVRIDNDMSICREMRQLYNDKKIILQVDIAESLCNHQKEFMSPLNCLGEAKAAIITGLIHHLIIDYGLNIEIFYQKLSMLYDNILLEFPTSSDPMVQLLIRKKNEMIFWDWEHQHLDTCSDYFDVVNKVNLKKERFIIQLKNKSLINAQK